MCKSETTASHLTSTYCLPHPRARLRHRLTSGAITIDDWKLVIYGSNDTRWPVPATNYPPMTGKVSTYNADGGKSGWISAQLFNITADPLEEHDLKDVAPAALERLNVTFQRLVSIMATGLSCEAQTGPGADSSLRVWREHNDTIGPYINDPLYMYECAVDFCTMVPSAAPSASPVPSLPNPTGSPTVPVPTTVHPSPQPDPAPTARPTAHPVPAPTARKSHPVPAPTAHEAHPFPAPTAHVSHPVPAPTVDVPHPAPAPTAHEPSARRWE